MSKQLAHWLVSLGIALAILAIAVLALIHWAGGDSTGTVHEGKPIEQAPKAAAQATPLVTDYFTSQLPPGYTIRRETSTPNAPIMLELLASDGKEEVGITIGQLPATGLAGLGDYNLRISHTSDYQPYRPAGLPTASTAFRALANPPSFTDFWPNGPVYAEISMTSDGAATAADIFGSFEQITHSWLWK